MRRTLWQSFSDMLLGRNADYRAVFGTEAGKRVLADIYNHAGVGRDNMPPGSTESDLVHREGMRRLALHISSILHHDDDDLLRIALSEKPYEVERGEPHDD